MNIITAAGVSFGLFLGISSFVAPAYAGTLGDVDNDGKVDVVEAIYALQISVGSTLDENKPGAVAGRLVSRNTVVRLCGSGSSAQDGAPLTYNWSMTSKPSGSAAVLSDSTIENPTFTADLAGSYIVSLTVHDGDRESVADSVVITVRNGPPIANAGVDQTVTIGDEVSLDGSGSSAADGDALTYRWILKPPTGSAAVLSDDAIDQPRFTADVPGYYWAELEVDYGDDVRSSDTVLITVIEFGTVTSAGQVWMDRNLGASRVATSATDAESYGDLYQWGRATDGHEKRDSLTWTTLSTSDTPGHGKFIVVSTDPWDWRTPQNDNLWQGATGINNPCPSGFRLPTSTELDTEMSSWSTPDSAGAYNSPLKLPLAGYRVGYEGGVSWVGEVMWIWSSTVTIYGIDVLYASERMALLVNDMRATGNSARCIKD